MTELTDVASLVPSDGPRDVYRCTLIDDELFFLRWNGSTKMCTICGMNNSNDRYRVLVVEGKTAAESFAEFHPFVCHIKKPTR